jgi:hypothetical protein
MSEYTSRDIENALEDRGELLLQLESDGPDSLDYTSTIPRSSTMPVILGKLLLTVLTANTRSEPQALRRSLSTRNRSRTLDSDDGKGVSRGANSARQ